jgi:hypothetical protein
MLDGLLGAEVTNGPATEGAIRTGRRQVGIASMALTTAVPSTRPLRRAETAHAVVDLAVFIDERAAHEHARLRASP